MARGARGAEGSGTGGAAPSGGAGWRTGGKVGVRPELGAQGERSGADLEPQVGGGVAHDGHAAELGEPFDDVPLGGRGLQRERRAVAEHHLPRVPRGARARERRDERLEATARGVIGLVNVQIDHQAVLARVAEERIECRRRLLLGLVRHVAAVGACGGAQPRVGGRAEGGEGRGEGGGGGRRDAWRHTHR